MKKVLMGFVAVMLIAGLPVLANDNVVVNGDFSQGDTGWSVVNNSGTGDAGFGGGTATITGPDGAGAAFTEIWQNVNGADGVDTIHSIDLGPNRDAVNYDFCEHVGVEISGYVYHDADNDGIRDSGEAPISGVTIQLPDENGNPTGQSTTTNADGYYDKLIEFLRHSVQEKFMSQAHLDLWHSVARAEDVPDALSTLEPWSADALKFASVDADDASASG